MAELHHFTTDLPPEIQLFHILPRLPAKSVLHFMCVSKQWHSFLKTTEFAKMHFRHITNDDHQNHHKLLFLSTTRPRMFSTFDCEAPEYRLTIGRPLPFKAMDGNMQIITSSLGLVCVEIHNNYDSVHFSDLILWNPLTGEHKMLSKDNSYKECYNCDRGASGLYYSSSDDDYKLLCVTYDHHAYIYSLKSDSWRKVEPNYKLGFGYELWISSSTSSTNTVVLNDKLYFLEPFGTRCAIVRVDIKTEMFTVIATPSSVDFNKLRDLYHLNFVVLKGFIHLYVVSNDLKTDWWRMDRDGDWTNVGSCYLPLPPSSSPEWLHLIRNGSCLIHSKERLCLYELDSKFHFNKFIYSYAASDMRINSSRVKFIETLVSPNQI